MQKKIIALAIAGLASSAAFAQTNVQIYGVADAYVSWSNGNSGLAANGGPGVEKHGRDTLGVSSGGLAASRIGFRGTEDLGNGLKALFVLEYGVDMVTTGGMGGGTTANNVVRQQLVGLSGGFGQLSLGRQYAPGFMASFRQDAQVASVLSAMTNMQAFLGGTIRAASNARWDNSIAYNTPTFGGVTVSTIYQGGANPNEIAARESYGVGVNYAGGPVVVDYVYQNATGNLGSVAGFPAGVRTEEHFLGASFDAKVVKVFANAQMLDQGNRAAAGIANKGMGYSLGAIVPVGKANIHLAYAQGDLDSNTRAVLVGGQTRLQGDYTATSAVLTYGLSKRTTLYTGYLYTDNGKANTTAAGIGNTFAAGINHSF